MPIKRENGDAAEVGMDRKVALAEALRRRILTMQIAPGAILEEGALAEEFGLSRPPVRELMRQMAGEGYLQIEANRGARVAPMSYESLREYYLVASTIYIMTTKLAAEKASKEDVATLRRIQSDFRRSASDGDVNERVFTNNEFHLEIGKVARNEYLIPSLRRLLIDHGRVGRRFFRSDPSAQAQIDLAADQHDQIIDAIEQHDPATAGTLVREHFELSRRNMAAYVVPDGMEVPIDV